MIEIVNCFIADGKKPEPLILVESIRKFAGKFTNSPIWAYTPLKENDFPTEMKSKFDALNVQLIYYDIEQDANAKFPFIDSVSAAATAEKMAANKTRFLIWYGVNSMILREPIDYILKEGINLGYRPVHHTLIGSIFNEPIDSFWKIIYEKCNVPKDKIFPMKTHVDHNILRPYFNSGFLIVRPERGLLQKYWKKYKEMYNDPIFDEFYKKDNLYITFIHQAVLSGVILSEMNHDEIQELPYNYNYPLHLHDETPIEYQPTNVDELITARFYINKLIDRGVENLPIVDKHKEFLKKKIEKR
ncbi:MAG: hypothetical protein FK731_12895 [Asgard group archaeon]|nr:hypothetical protein [Asgard group archaeon]